MSTNPEKAVSYVLSKYVTEYMNKDVLKLSMKTQTRDAATMLRSYETDDIIVIDKKNSQLELLQMKIFSAKLVMQLYMQKQQH